MFWMCTTSSSSTCYLNCAQKENHFEVLLLEQLFLRFYPVASSKFLPSKHHQAPGLAGWVPSPSRCVLQGLGWHPDLFSEAPYQSISVTAGLWLEVSASGMATGTHTSCCESPNGGRGVMFFLLYWHSLLCVASFNLFFLNKTFSVVFCSE